MPMAGKGMLLTSMNIDASDEAEFNRWYDREHLEERVAIDGCLEARRYVAQDSNQKYLSLYSTETYGVLDSPAYRTALANQTAWSKANIARFQNMIRAVARITVSQGTGRGAALGIVRLRPPAGESDPALSKPITDNPSASNPGAGDWFVLIDATDVGALPAAMLRFSGNTAVKPLIISSGTYRLMWDLAKSDIGG